MTRSFTFNTSVPIVALTAAVMLGVPASVSSAHPRSDFDGAWSVMIITEQGSCGPVNRFPLQIKSGRVLPGDESGQYIVNGQVNPGGGVSVTVAQGAQRANGTGRLRGSNGRGVWKSPSGCAGRWEAERRT
jgi:hypothetical protein